MTWSLTSCTYERLCSWSRLSTWTGVLRCALSCLLAISVLSSSPSLLMAQGGQEKPALSAKERAKIAFKKGSQAFAKEQWSEALTYFEEAYQAYPLPLMMFNIASTYERLGDLPTAIERYQAFVATGKDDGDAANRVKTLTERLASWAELRLSSIPSQAEVYIGNERKRSRGKTPLTLRLPPQQTLALTLVAEGYLSKTITPRFKPQEQQSLKVQLKGKPAFVRVLGTPQEAMVKVSGQEGGKKGLPFTQELTAGIYELEISAPGYVPQRKTVTLTSVHKQDAPLVVEVKLASSEGVALLNLTADQDGALLFVDGKPAGQTPLSSPLKLKQGEHLIELKGAKGGHFVKKVTFKAGATQFVNAQLSSGFTFTQKHIGYTLASLGVASLIGGFISGGMALSSSGDLDECRADFKCNRAQGELDLAQEIRAYTGAADWMIGIGFALAAGGATLILLDQTDPPPSLDPPTTTPPNPQPKAYFSLSPTLGGLNAVGGFTF